MTVFLQLGSLALEGFEVPGRVALGGAQSLAVHKLPGGVRVVDTMGRDDADLTWSGVISGGGASERARLLDAMRAAGDVISLSWDQFYYAVVVGHLKLEYCNPWWIEYSITCKVITDQAQASVGPVIVASNQIASDLQTAGAYVDVSVAASAAASAAGARPGTPAAALASVRLAAVQAQISQNITLAEQSLASADLATAVEACGHLAQFTCALGFVNRAAKNLTEALV